MHRPLREPFWSRVWRLIRGILFYNTVYWERASDAVKLPETDLAVREALRPERNLELIRPRAVPRANSDEKAKPRPAKRLGSPPPTASSDPAAPAPVANANASEVGEVYIKRRRYKRHRKEGSSGGLKGFMRRVFGRR